MADIELVIKIPENKFQDPSSIDFFYMVGAIRNGTPLPKGHGDLIDANELKKVYDERISYLYTLNKKDNPSREAKMCATNWCANTIDELQTIIEADTESEVEI